RPVGLRGRAPLRETWPDRPEDGRRGEGVARQIIPSRFGTFSHSARHTGVFSVSVRWNWGYPMVWALRRSARLPGGIASAGNSDAMSQLCLVMLDRSGRPASGAGRRLHVSWLVLAVLALVLTARPAAAQAV